VFLCIDKSIVYSLIGTITENQQEQCLMSSIEGVFMIGIAFSVFLVPAFNSDANPDAWLNVYWLLAGISLSFGFLFLPNSKIKRDSHDLADDFKEMFKLFAKLLTSFVISAFLFVMIEQGLGCQLLIVKCCIFRRILVL
jgi:Na+-transporting NADH:ubiquinone oxidoreductase subunit NqrB